MISRTAGRLAAIGQSLSLWTLPMPSLKFWKGQVGDCCRRAYFSLSVAQILLVLGYMASVVACFVVGAELTQNSNRPGTCSIKCSQLKANASRLHRPGATACDHPPLTQIATPSPHLPPVPLIRALQLPPSLGRADPLLSRHGTRRDVVEPVHLQRRMGSGLGGQDGAWHDRLWVDGRCGTYQPKAREEAVLSAVLACTVSPLSFANYSSSKALVSLFSWASLRRSGIIHPTATHGSTLARRSTHTSEAIFPPKYCWC